MLASKMAFVLSALASVTDGPAPTEGCTAATVTGQYVFAGRGFIERLEPGIQRMHYGVFIFDGKGKLSGKQSSSRGGKIGREQLEGSYSVDSDCTGRMTFRFLNRPGTETQWDLYLTEDGRKGHILRMDEGNMAVRTFEK
jgi:hypothetical protein